MAAIELVASSPIKQGRYDPHSIASIAWAFATLVVHDQQLIAAISEAPVQLPEFNTQDLSNTAWALATLSYGDSPLMTAITEASLIKLASFKRGETEMLLWSLAPWRWETSLKVLRDMDRTSTLRPLGLSPILCEAERRADISTCASLLRRTRALAESPGLYDAVQGLSARLLAISGCASAALQVLDQCSPEDALARGVLAACGGELSLLRGDLHAGSTPLASGSKPALAMQYVLQKTDAGQADKVLAALESFALQVLKPSRQWFKIAGGAKARVVEEALQLAPKTGASLEIGTYVGFTAIRFAASRTEGRVITIEVEPEHAVVAQRLAFHAGVSHKVDVWTGQSSDVLRSLEDRYPGETPQFALVFMDQCGSRFWQDLEILLDKDLLLPGAVILADNVLKPGAPLFLWHLFHGRGSRIFSTELVSLEEFAMEGVEDCMALAVYKPAPAGHAGTTREIPEMVLDLESQANKKRTQAFRPGSVPFEDWAVFADGMKGSLSELGIKIGRQV